LIRKGHRLFVAPTTLFAFGDCSKGSSDSGSEARCSIFEGAGYGRQLRRQDLHHSGKCRQRSAKVRTRADRFQMSSREKARRVWACGSSAPKPLLTPEQVSQLDTSFARPDTVHLTPCMNWLVGSRQKKFECIAHPRGVSPAPVHDHGSP
jgi:hypothetical protein